MPTEDSRRPRRVRAWWALFVLAGCASRAVPTQLPPTSPASPRAVEAPRAPAPLTLAGEPPLPGEPAGRWTGLAAPATDPAHGGTHHAR